MEASAAFPWRQLGDLLVEQQLLTEQELEHALAEQARSGRLLGQILVGNGYLSAFSLARVLSEQHGIELRRAQEDEEPAQPELSLVDAGTSWRPLGRLLVERGFLTESELASALQEQEAGHGRLGEILVSRGLLTGSQLARALAEQQGVTLEPEAELETHVREFTSDEPVYRVFEVVFEPGFQRRKAVHESGNFLDAADFAFEYVERHDPAALEIHRTDGVAQEAVWNYSASRAAAASVARKNLVETFGFDPTRWGSDR